MVEAVVLSVGLAMDATAVATARSVSGAPRRDLLTLAIAFGLFQTGMAAVGWWAGAAAAAWIEAWDHWIAFGLLLLIGGKMFYEAIRGREDSDRSPPRIDARAVVVLSIATSIDALAAGVTLPTIGAPPIVSLVLIGVVTFVLSAAGGLVGARLGAHLGQKLEVAGGLALIGIGIKTLVDHLG